MRVLQLGMTGTDIMEIQALLQKMGYNPGPVDGVFGPQTQRAVIAFQRNNGLAADGIIGQNTHAALQRYLSGYDLYTIRRGDTFYNIARRYNTNPVLIFTANPGLNPNRLEIGTQIVVPYATNVVDTNIDYTYDILQRDILGLKARYPFLETGVAGKSVLGRDLTYLRLGTGENKIFYNGAHHSLEWITSPLLMKFVEDISKAYALGQRIAGYDPNEIFEKSSIYIIPMVNPDGVELVLNGLSPANPYYADLIRWNGGSSDFSNNWQANNRGVDLNHNYDAAWDLSKQAEAEYGITGPGPTRYSGPYLESEPETQAVVEFTNSHNFNLVIAYHTQGQVIYWEFMDLTPPNARPIAEQFSTISGYMLDQTTGIASYAGYKDWFIQQYARPGFTVEAGLGTNPLPISDFDAIYKDNIGIMLYAPFA